MTYDLQLQIDGNSTNTSASLSEIRVIDRSKSKKTEPIYANGANHLNGVLSANSTQHHHKKTLSNTSNSSNKSTKNVKLFRFKICELFIAPFLVSRE